MDFRSGLPFANRQADLRGAQASADLLFLLANDLVGIARDRRWPARLVGAYLRGCDAREHCQRANHQRAQAKVNIASHDLLSSNELSLYQFYTSRTIASEIKGLAQKTH
ncbi:MAG: hypothetical protein M3448_10045, partial [Pseudomonadota bacterium]|nr:hypothetical protein [Pseudomonadota bacterium]